MRISWIIYLVSFVLESNYPGFITRAEVVKLGAGFSLSTRTVDEILRNALVALWSKPKAGLYQKL